MLAAAKGSCRAPSGCRQSPGHARVAEGSWGRQGKRAAENPGKRTGAAGWVGWGDTACRQRKIKLCSAWQNFKWRER